jgi:peptide/nickel transport system substrate-binding protein
MIPLRGIHWTMDKANQLLDDAGYVDIDDDGFREDPDGNKLTINFAFYVWWGNSAASS